MVNNINQSIKKKTISLNFCFKIKTSSNIFIHKAAFKKYVTLQGGQQFVTANTEKEKNAHKNYFTRGTIADYRYFVLIQIHKMRSDFGLKYRLERYFLETCISNI